MFKVGDAVRLISGGPRMTVESIFDDMDGVMFAGCVWFTRDAATDAWSGPHREKIAADLLRKVKP